MASLPKLYKQTSTGKIQEWGIEARWGNPENAPTIVTVYGLLDGKKQVAREVISRGKNIGKANETSPMEQAQLEAQAQWEQKLKKGYVQILEDAEAGKKDAIIAGGIAPMLAHSYDKQGHKIKYPAFVQPKLDGHRCIAIVQDGVCTLWSRTQKLITGVPHIARELEKMYPTGRMQFDGELYHHDYREKFEELTSFIRSATPKPGHEVVQYWIYDLPGPSSFGERNEVLQTVAAKADSTPAIHKIVIVPTEKVETEEEMISVFGAYLDLGFEGLMVRNSGGNYKNGRSYDLQKVKTFQDAEYEVVAIEEGKGKMAGKALFVCDAGNGKTFRVKMKGALDDLKDYFDNPEPWIGKQLTVKYQKFSAEGIPIFPIGMRFREDV